jgi:hypothetical protein
MLYIGTDEGIYRWYQGSPWPIFHSLQERSIVALASPGGGVLAALDHVGRIWESETNGLDWREVSRPEGLGRPTALVLAGAPSEIVLAAARPLALIRRPLGLEIEAESPSPLDRARRLFGGRSGAGSATLERPPNGDRGWNPIGVPALEAGGITPTIRALVPGAIAGAPWFAAVAGAGLWRSDDGATSWQRCEGLPLEVYAIRAPGEPAGLVAAGTSDGCWISHDGGRTWADQSAGLDHGRQVRALEIKPGDPKVLLAGAAPRGAGEGPVADRGGLRFALFESKDGGKSWKHVTRGFPDLLEFDQIADIRYDPADTDSAAVALASGEIWNTRTDGVWWEPFARQIRTARCLCAVI